MSTRRRALQPKRPLTDTHKTDRGSDRERAAGARPVFTTRGPGGDPEAQTPQSGPSLRGANETPSSAGTPEPDASRLTWALGSVLLLVDLPLYCLTPTCSSMTCLCTV
ncbi:unnamed protein product [Boreogadus saida]